MRKLKYIDYIPNIYEYNEEDNVRYVLGNEGTNTLMCVGINPNVACKDYSDATMNKLINFARREGYDSCIMMNPCPMISQRPDGLPEVYDDTLLLQNSEWIEQIFSNQEGGDVLVMWGDYIERNRSFKKSVINIIEMSIKYKMRLIHINKLSCSGNPYHFMYLSRNAEYNQGKYVINELSSHEYLDRIKRDMNSSI